MKVETKYNSGQTVYRISNNRVEKVTLSNISISIHESGAVCIEYNFSVSNGNLISEGLLFTTKAELLASL